MITRNARAIRATDGRVASQVRAVFRVRRVLLQAIQQPELRLDLALLGAEDGVVVGAAGGGCELVLTPNADRIMAARKVTIRLHLGRSIRRNGREDHGGNSLEH